MKYLYIMEKDDDVTKYRDYFDRLVAKLLQSVDYFRDFRLNFQRNNGPIIESIELSLNRRNSSLGSRRE